MPSVTSININKHQQPNQNCPAARCCLFFFPLPVPSWPTSQKMETRDRENQWDLFLGHGGFSTTNDTRIGIQ